MKIGIEIQRLFRKNKFGIETSSLEFIKALKELESKHEYVIFARDDVDRQCLTPSHNMKIKLVAGKLFADFEQFFLPIAVKREHVDVLHCTGNTAPLFSPVPVIQTLHDVIFMDAIPAHDSLYQRYGNQYRRKVVPLVTPRSKAVITVSNYERERIIQRLGIKREKVHVVYNGINEKRFNNHFTMEGLQAVRMKYHLPENFILFLGNGATRKNPIRVIEAYLKYASQTEQPLPLVTPGLTERYLSENLRKLNQSEKRQLFISPGYIDDQDLPFVYGLSRMFLFPSLSEGFGMPLVEAMACGAPVLTSSTSCLPEIADNAAILVDPFQVDAIAAGIISLANDEGLRNNMIAAGLRNARRFSWKSSAETVLTIYEAVFAESRATSKHPGFLNKYVYATRD